MRYRRYHPSKKERIAVGGAILFLLYLLEEAFYHNVFFLPFFLPGGLFLWKLWNTHKARERRRELNLAFRDGLHSLVAALSGGYSVENSFQEAVMDLERIYSPRADIVVEFQQMVQKICHNIPAEKAVQEFAERSHVEDIQNFAHVFSTAKRTGGDMIHVMEATSRVIEDKIEVRREIRTMIAGKKLEGRIMEGVPLGILFYLRLCSPASLLPLYGNFFGICFMTLMLGIYLLGIWLTERILSGTTQEEAL